MTPQWWTSIAAARRFARTATVTAIVGIAVGVTFGTRNMFVAAIALSVGAAGVLCAMFARFRAEHLRELDELRRSP